MNPNTNLPQQAIAVDSWEDAQQLIKVLSDNCYVVMLSREENLWTINYIWEPTANRNDVIFIDREQYEYELEHTDK